MTTVVVEDGPEHVEVPATQGEVIAAETVETVAEASVEIAGIEAARDIAIAEIAAETTTEIIAAEDNRTIEQLRLEIVECRTRAEVAEAQNTELTAQLLTLQQSTPLPAPEPNLLDDAVNEVTLASPEEQKEPPPEPNRKEPRFRWI